MIAHVVEKGVSSSCSRRGDRIDRSCAHAAVDDEQAAGHEAALIGREEQDGTRDLLGNRMPAEWNQFVEEAPGIAPEHDAQLLLDPGLEGVAASDRDGSC